MTDLSLIAPLVLSIDSRPAADAAAALDRFAQSARPAGQGADAFVASAAKMSPALQQTGSAAAQAAVGLDRHTKSLNDNAKQAGLSFLQFEVLRSSVERFSDSVIAGQSPLHAFVQQASGATAAIGEDGLSGLAKRAAVSVSGLASGAAGAAAGIGVVGAVVGTVAGALAVAVLAQQSYAASQMEVTKSLLGVGQASGATVTSINAAAQANASAGGISVRSARETASAFAATGRITGEMYADLVRSTKDFAATTGTDVPAAAAALASAFADPARGAETLNRSLGFLSATSKETIERLSAQGDRLGAQKALFDAYSTSLTKASDLTSGWARITAAAGTTISDIWDRIGRTVDRAVTGGTLDEQLDTAKKRLADAQANARRPLGFLNPSNELARLDTERQQGTVNSLQQQIDERTARTERAQAAQRSLEIGGVINSLLPEQNALKALQDQVTRVRAAIAQPAKFGLDTRALAETESAFERISRSLRTATDDVERFGSASTAALNRQADLGARTVGFTPLGRSAADRQNAFEQAARDKGLDPSGPSVAQVRATYNERISDPNLDVREQMGLAAAREAALRNATELAGLQRARDVDLSTSQRQAGLDQNQLGGAFSRLSPEVQQQFLTAAQSPRYARVPVGIAAAIAGPESNGNLDVGFSRQLGEDGRPSSAYGLGQITAGTAREAVAKGYLPDGYDRMSRDTAAEGILGVLSMKLDQNGGDTTKAIMAYRGSSDPGINRAYAATVLRNAGQMGDASTAGQVRDQDANNRALEQANDNVRNITENYGRNSIALEANGRAQDQYRQLLARGIPAADAASIAFDGLQTKIATLGQAAKFVQFGRDDAFARDQLGRDRYDQAGASAARPYAGTPYEGVVRDTARDTAMLTDARSTLTSAAQSFASDLLHGKSAASAFSSALDSIANKLLSSVTDSLVGGLFGGNKGNGGSGGGLLSMLGLGGGSPATGALQGPTLSGATLDQASGGGGLLSGLAQLFGFADGGFTGYGGRNQPAGIVHAGEVVWSQRDVARYGGPATVNAMRLGFPGFADGGPVMPNMPNLATLPTMQTAANANVPPAGRQPVAISIDARGAQGNSEVQAAISRGVAQGISAYDRGLDQTIHTKVDTARANFGGSR